MPRIRNIKPGFWDSPDTARADLAVRLLFMALWNWADDSGRGTANLKELEGFAFPNDDIAELPRRSRGNSAGTPGTAPGGWRNFAEILAEVQDCYGVVFYKVRGRPYYWIPSFRDHQSKDFRPNSNHPAPEEGEIWALTCGNTPNTAPAPDPRPTPVPEFPHLVAESPPHTAEIVPLDRDKDLDRDRDPDHLVTTTRKPTSAIAKKANVDTLRIIHAWTESQIPTIIPTQIVNDATAQVQALVNQGIPTQQIAVGIAEWWDSRKYPPSTIPNYVARAGQPQPQQRQRATGTDRAAEILALPTDEPPF